MWAQGTDRSAEVNTRANDVHSTYEMRKNRWPENDADHEVPNIVRDLELLGISFQEIINDFLEVKSKTAEIKGGIKDRINPDDGIFDGDDDDIFDK